ncbi:hypothetical protein TPHA_0C04670 [Tetrapisispora phaffii CBS 4417]|uniref:DUF676 domain-containing protein n=1 Tax=Tetrapisispora phaffii (strain ATCC 24235 / CBS 4417 / NBRC 1672 / NRRL Y-8282 / UCD 70-5) TaxID=1071381 RepID=G8BQV5_TETPH|nr:hypothetical protein TPHA_0C04670 [Tetrapisispora phaffii CBS 4417]CCE62617.1 hypothetical protein TPHA_0C04670 [Tetrapisispora phaffii CBS 4417]
MPEVKNDSDVLYYNTSQVKVGEIERYIITFNLYEGDVIPEDISLESLWVEVKNTEGLSYRAAYLIGPFTLYCDVKTSNYHHSQKIISSLDEPKYEPNLQPQQTFKAELSLHEIKRQYVWIVDIVSQIIFTSTTQTGFEISIKRPLCLVGGEVVPLSADSFNVNRLNTLDIWNLPLQIYTKQEKKHLVILTHGLHSNTTSDMSYIMEQIYKTQVNFPNEQIIVKGFTKNVCQTEKGVKYLGTNLAKYIIDELYDPSVTKISFIGHSLGGLIQSFAIAYIAVIYPWFFDKVQPINFITLASPLLGIVTDNPKYINLLLSFGVIGKTGQDLKLERDNSTTEPKLANKCDIDNDPLLFKLPGDPLNQALQLFKRRTVYANAINDGLVPLYSSALLYLDYENVTDELRLATEYDDLDDSAEIESILSGEAMSSNYYDENLQALKKTFVSPITKILNIWNPQTYLSKNSSKLPRLSMFKSATSILIPPLPDREFILDPSTRSKVILHDRIYTEEYINEIDKEFENPYLNDTNMLLKAFTIARGKGGDFEQKLEERIARMWHKNLSWRKVVVALKPDAHNNILVRRRFVNAHGWLVIDHLIENHFMAEENNIELAASDETYKSSINNHIASTAKILDITSNIEPNKKYSWLTRKEAESIFDEGPTGMISTVSEMFDSFAKTSLSGEIDRNNNQNKIVPDNTLFGDGNSDMIL